MIFNILPAYIYERMQACFPFINIYISSITFTSGGTQFLFLISDLCLLCFISLHEGSQVYHIIITLVY